MTVEEEHHHLGALAHILLDCVQGGASVSFLSSLTQDEAETFFKNVFEGVRTGDRILLGAFIDSQLVGTVQVVNATPPNQPHRADIAKLLVLGSARKQGVGRRLMEKAEEASRNAGKSLLVLDTVTGDPGESLYLSLRWNKVGIIPKYALYPDGTFCDTTVFWKWVG